MVSAMTGEWLDGPELDAGYWYDEPACPGGVRPVGPGAGRRRAPGVHRDLPAPGADRRDHRRPLESRRETEPAVTGTLRRDDGGPARLLASFAEAHTRGVGAGLDRGPGRARRVGAADLRVRAQAVLGAVAEFTESAARGGRGRGHRSRRGNDRGRGPSVTTISWAPAADADGRPTPCGRAGRDMAAGDPGRAPGRGPCGGLRPGADGARCRAVVAEVRPREANRAVMAARIDETLRNVTEVAGRAVAARAGHRAAARVPNGVSRPRGDGEPGPGARRRWDRRAALGGDLRRGGRRAAEDTRPARPRRRSGASAASPALSIPTGGAGSSTCRRS